MKNNSTSTRASVFFKRMISVFWSIAKAKSLALRNKTEALKCRLTVLSLLKNKKFSLGSISHKIQTIMGQQQQQQQHDKKEEEEEEEEEEDDDDDQSRAIAQYNASAPSSSIHTQMEEEEEEFEDQEEKYPDLRHTLFEEEDDELDLGDPNGSVIDLVRNCKELGGEEDFKLEDEIDQVADLFILKFHKRMRMQKLESFKRYQEMLQRSL